MPLAIFVDDGDPSGMLTDIRTSHPGWTCDAVDSADELRLRLDSGGDAKPDVIAVDLGLPPHEFEHVVGVKLLEELRAHPAFGSRLTLIAYTRNEVKSAETVKRVLLARASLFDTHAKPGAKWLVASLPKMREGYCIIDPSATALLPAVIISTADPLDDDQWRLLKKLSAHETAPVAHVAEEYRMEERNIYKTLAKITATLEKNGLIERMEDSPANRNKRNRRVIDFYRTHHVRYGR